tara:strand:- start:3935 stop:4297 length:363 start_codon:yes stop_codon:yes gene_type:complete
MSEKEKQYQTIVKATFYAQLLLESLDDVSELPIFKHSLKFKVKQAEKELEKATSRLLDTMYGNDEEFFVNLQKHTDSLISKLSKMGLDELPLANHCLDEYIKDSDKWKENIIIQFTKLNG